MMDVTSSSNPLGIAAERAKDICDRLWSSQVNQGIKKTSPATMEIVKTLKAIKRLNFWSLEANRATQAKQQFYLDYANSCKRQALTVCQPQIKKHGSVEKFLAYAETLIPVDENTRKAQ